MNVIKNAYTAYFGLKPFSSMMQKVRNKVSDDAVYDRIIVDDVI